MQKDSEHHDKEDTQPKASPSPGKEPAKKDPVGKDPAESADKGKSENARSDKSVEKGKDDEEEKNRDSSFSLSNSDAAPQEIREKSSSVRSTVGRLEPATNANASHLPGKTRSSDSTRLHMEPSTKEQASTEQSLIEGLGTRTGSKGAAINNQGLFRSRDPEAKVVGIKDERVKIVAGGLNCSVDGNESEQRYTAKCNTLDS
jgi:hypothetical protein